MDVLNGRQELFGVVSGDLLTKCALVLDELEQGAVRGELGHYHANFLIGCVWALEDCILVVIAHLEDVWMRSDPGVVLELVEDLVFD